MRGGGLGGCEVVVREMLVAAHYSLFKRKYQHRKRFRKRRFVAVQVVGDLVPDFMKLDVTLRLMFWFSL